MRKVNQQSLLKTVAFIFLIFNTHFTYSFASVDDENAINKIFETHGKTSVVNFILQKNHGKITIQKKKSFLNVTGRPSITLVTAKSVNHDLKNLKIDISTLEAELDTYIKKESKKQQKANNNLRKLASDNDKDEIPLSQKLKHQIRKTQSKYDKADSDYESEQLKKELSKLQKKYRKAKYDEKHHPDGYLADKSSRNKKTYRNKSYCKSYKSQLQKLTESSYRHSVFFCKDKTYRAKNPRSCSKYRYTKQYSLQEYKDKINKLRQDISNNCGT